MRTVKDIADELDISRQTVYVHIKKNKAALKPYINKIGNTTHVEEEGFMIIKESLGLVVSEKPIKQEDFSVDDMVDMISKNITENVMSTLNPTLNNINQSYEDVGNTVIEGFKLQNDQLKRENRELRKQIKELESKLDEIIEMILEKKDKSLFEKLFK